jgi:hypothetical protein
MLNRNIFKRYLAVIEQELLLFVGNTGQRVNEIEPSCLGRKRDQKQTKTGSIQENTCFRH